MKPREAFQSKKAILCVLVFLIVCSSWAIFYIKPRNTLVQNPVSSQCAKIPPSLSNALVYYVTSNATPQQTPGEIALTQRILEKKSPCNFLVFGLGLDSLMWSSLNHMGRTVFLEENKQWIDIIKSAHPYLESHLVEYRTKVSQAEALLVRTKGAEECGVVVDPRVSKCEIAHKEFPQFVYEIEWDVIMVDGPTGYHAEAPGRMSVIYTAGLMARNTMKGEVDVFVHDVDRVVEDGYSKGFLCEGYVVEQVGRLRHFRIPSHRMNLGARFCP